MRTQRVLLAVTLPLLGLLLTACGKHNAPGVATAGGAGGAKPSASPVDRAEAQRRFAQCMREHGVDMPDPEPGVGKDPGMLKLPDGTIDKGKIKEAMEACQSLMPNGGAPPSLSPEQLEQARKFAQCMRDHGVDMPDPDPNTGAARIILNGDIDVNSQQFKDALNACKDQRPGAVK